MKRPSQTNETCIECGLFNNCKSPFMSSSGADSPKILVIGEAPGEEEDNAGQPFVGRSGKLLRQVLDEVGIDDNSVRFTNVVRCRPEDNKITKSAIEHCRKFALADIKKHAPAIVMLMGNTPLSAILGESGITNWHGSQIVKYVNDVETLFVPLYHPAYILRDKSKTNEWIEAIFNVIDPEEDKPKVDVILPKNIDDLTQMEMFLREHKEIIFDFETTSLDAFSKNSCLIAVSFAAGDKAYAFPLEHKQAIEWWDDSDYDMVDYSLKIAKSVLLMHSGNLIGHNVKFDKVWAISQLGIDVETSGDPMLVSHLLDSKPGQHGLKRLAGMYCGMYEYESDLTDYIRAHADADPRRGGNYGNIPLSILLPYAGNDAKATLILHSVLFPKLNDTQVNLYKELVMPASNALSRMQANGFAIDKFIAHRYYHIYSYLMKCNVEGIRSDKKVIRITKARNDALALAHKKSGRFKPFVFNPNSPVQLSELFFTRYNVPILARSKKTKNPSTSSKVYRTLEGEYPILKSVREYKMYLKALSTYLGPAMKGNWLSDDGLVHSTFNQHTTVTSRLSSSDPVNLQNMPTPEKEPGTVLEFLPIKNIFTHRDWWDVRGNDIEPADIFNDVYDTGALVMADYSGMELRVFASLANCEPMLAIHRSGLDFHSMVAIMSLEHKYPDQIDPVYVSWFKKNKSEIRYRYKWTNWTLLYGGDAYTLHRLYNVPIDEAEDTIKMYYGLFPEVLEYREWTQEFAEDNGYIESPFGRREYLAHINDTENGNLQKQNRRAAVNMPVQSGASDIVMCALIVLDHRLPKSNLAAKLVNTVHDSIVADSPRYEIDTVGNLLKDSMENVVEYSKTYLPHIDMSWLKCPLVADIDVGTHYGVHTDLKDWIVEFGHNYVGDKK